MGASHSEAVSLWILIAKGEGCWIYVFLETSLINAGIRILTHLIKQQGSLFLCSTLAGLCINCKYPVSCKGICALLRLHLLAARTQGHKCLPRWHIFTHTRDGQKHLVLLCWELAEFYLSIFLPYLCKVYKWFTYLCLKLQSGIMDSSMAFKNFSMIKPLKLSI